MTTYKFTNCGATGYKGPTQANVDNEYGSLGYSVISRSGIQEFVVPVTGMYRITAIGAGAVPGKRTAAFPAKVTSHYPLERGDVLYILVGQAGQATAQAGGGGGGTFVAIKDPSSPNLLTVANNTPVKLLVAAGGVGGFEKTYGDNEACNGQTIIVGGTTTTKSGYSGRGGTAGYGGIGESNNGASAGGGFLTNGSNGKYGSGGASFLNGGKGGTRVDSGTPYGGFGGGGSTHGNSGGGGGAGGYSGGSGGNHNYVGHGGGGGSFSLEMANFELHPVASAHGLVTLDSVTDFFNLKVKYSQTNSANNITISNTMTQHNDAHITIYKSDSLETLYDPSSVLTTFQASNNDFLDRKIAVDTTYYYGGVLHVDGEPLYTVPTVTIRTAIEYTFTNCGTTGHSGPSAAAILKEYAHLPYMPVGYSGIQKFTIEEDGWYKITAIGAHTTAGKRTVTNAGKVTSTFALHKGDDLYMLVGQAGQNGTGAAGGGGGTFIAVSDPESKDLLTVANNAPVRLLTAAGGVGGYQSSFTNHENSDAQLTTSGGTTTTKSGYSGRGGTDGKGGIGESNSGASGGGGFYTNGSNGNYGSGGASFLNGGQGGTRVDSGTPYGGFGGGASTHGNTGGGGGAGGYSGGSGGNHDHVGHGGGGGCYSEDPEAIFEHSPSTENTHGIIFIKKIANLEVERFFSTADYETFYTLDDTNEITSMIFMDGSQDEVLNGVSSLTQTEYDKLLAACDNAKLVKVSSDGYVNEMVYTISAIPKPVTVVTPVAFDTAGYTISHVTVSISDPSARYFVSFDNGATWCTYTDGTWQPSVAGCTVDDLVGLRKNQWARADYSNGIKFKIILEPTTLTTTLIKNIEVHMLEDLGGGTK